MTPTGTQISRARAKLKRQCMLVLVGAMVSSTIGLGDTSLPPILGEGRREIVHDRVPLARVYVGFRAPALPDHRLDALDVAGQILAGGKGSRLHVRLVRRDRLAQDVALFTLGLVAGASMTI